MDNTNSGAIFAFMLPFLLFGLACAVFSIICMWKVFRKAGFEGWESIVPIYSTLIMLKIIGKPWWWLLLLLIPFVNIVIAIMMLDLLSKSFGRSTGFTIGLIFLNFIFLAILAFDRTIVYLGPAGDPNAARPQDDIGSIGKSLQ
ncbi:DUF5684 domain-containing protein [Chitinophaga qingshengii]|uniref:Signal peptidase I n=1 Tax=Chitinophaga qingshengii TaxID=1569794 RepID=A0ABR7TVY0_9BACT|nr:DUF5684 domain-containing protein [Chitinophaga qingshengii]MBC9934592.1 hypothetical protein [Chitinophaga qingshengii]